MSRLGAIGALEKILSKYDDGRPNLRGRKSNALSDLQYLLDDSSSVVSQNTIDILESIYDYIHSNFEENTETSNSEIDTIELMSTLQEIVRPKRNLSQGHTGSSSLPPRLRDRKTVRPQTDDLSPSVEPKTFSSSSSQSTRDSHGSKSSKTKQKSNRRFSNDLDLLLNKFDNSKDKRRGDSKLLKQEQLERSLKNQIASAMVKKSKDRQISNSVERRSKKKNVTDATIGSKVSLEKAVKKLIKKKIAEKTGIEVKKENPDDAAARTLEKKVNELTAMLQKEKDMLDELDEFGKVLENKMVQHERIQLANRVEKLELQLNEQQRRKKQKLGELSDLISKSHTEVDYGEYEQPQPSMNSTIETEFDYNGMEQHHFENLDFYERRPSIDVPRQLPDNQHINHTRRASQSPRSRRQYSPSQKIRRQNRQETRFSEYDQRIPPDRFHQPMMQYGRSIDEYDDDNHSYYEPQSRMQSTAGGVSSFTKVGFDYGQEGTSEYTPRNYNSSKHRILRPALRSHDQRSYGGRGELKLNNSMRSIPPVQFHPRNVRASPEDSCYSEYYEDQCTQYTGSLPPPSQQQRSIQTPSACSAPQYQHSLDNSSVIPLTEAMEKKIYDKVVSSIFSNEAARRALANDKKRNVRDDAEIIALAAISSLKAGRTEDEVKDIIANLLETYIDQRNNDNTDSKENRNTLNIMNDSRKGKRGTSSRSSVSHRESTSRSAKSSDSSRSDSSVVNLKWANMSVAAAATVLQTNGNEHVAKEAASAVLKFYKKEGRYMDANLAVGLAAANASTAVLSAGGERPSAAAVSVAVLKSASMKNSSKLLRKLASLNLISSEDEDSNDDNDDDERNRNYERNNRNNRKSEISLSEKMHRSKQSQNILRVTPSIDGTSLEVSLTENHNYDGDYDDGHHYFNGDELSHYKKSRSSQSKKSSRERRKQNYHNQSTMSRPQQEPSAQNLHLPLKNYQRSGLPPRYPSSADTESSNNETSNKSSNSKGSTCNNSDRQKAIKQWKKERNKKVSKRVTQIMEGLDVKQNPNVVHVKNGLFGNFFKRLRKKRISI